MWLVNIALRRPIMIVVLVVGILLCSVLAYERMAVDIFPESRFAGDLCGAAVRRH